MVPYHPSTLLQFITSDTFYIKINHNELYAVLYFDDDVALDVTGNSMEDLSVRTALNILGNTPMKTDILSRFVSNIVKKVLIAKGKEEI